MDERLNDLGKRYASASDEELRYIAVTGDLAFDAKPILEKELARRGIRDLEDYKQQLDRDEALRREDLKRRLAEKERVIWRYSRIVGAIFVLLFLAGAARLYFGGNDRYGVPLMIFSVVSIALLPVNNYLVRLILRFVFRP